MFFQEESAQEAIDLAEPEDVEETEEGDAEEKTTDPLDDIQDPEARAEAKRSRAIARRSARKTVEEEPVVQESNVATKDDLKRMATADAKRNVEPEILEAWDELVKIPLGGFDSFDSASIAANMKQRFTIWRASQSTEAEETIDPTKTSASPTGTAKAPKAQGGEASLPGYSEPKQPEDWYPE